MARRPARWAISIYRQNISRSVPMSRGRDASHLNRDSTPGFFVERKDASMSDKKYVIDIDRQRLEDFGEIYWMVELMKPVQHRTQILNG